MRDIVADCVASIDSVGNESRMAADALANRVNLLESGLTNVINGKISVVEEAVAARNHDQNEVNVKVNERLLNIVASEEREHVERTTVEGSLKDRVGVVEERVDGEILQVRREADEHAIKTKEELDAAKQEINGHCKEVSGPAG